MKIASNTLITIANGTSGCGGTPKGGQVWVDTKYMVMENEKPRIPSETRWSKAGKIAAAAPILRTFFESSLDEPRRVTPHI